VDSKARIWRADPATLRDVLVDPGAVEDRLQECPPLERVWILSLLGRDEQAVAAGRRLLADSRDRFRPLPQTAASSIRSVLEILRYREGIQVSQQMVL
jgi:hypothetical protein